MTPVYQIHYTSGEKTQHPSVVSYLTELAEKYDHFEVNHGIVTDPLHRLLAQVKEVVRFPGGDVDVVAFRRDSAATRTTLGVDQRVTNRRETERQLRANGQFDMANMVRENTDILEAGGEIRRRMGGARDDE